MGNRASRGARLKMEANAKSSPVRKNTEDCGAAKASAAYLKKAVTLLGVCKVLELITKKMLDRPRPRGRSAYLCGKKVATEELQHPPGWSPCHLTQFSWSKKYVASSIIT